MSKKSFEDQLKDNTNEYSPVPREGMWEAIEASLPPEKKRRKGIIFFLLSGISIAAILICTLISPNTSVKKEAATPVLSRVEPQNQDTKTLTSNANESSPIIQQTNTPSSELSQASTHHEGKNDLPKYKTVISGKREKPIIKHNEERPYFKSDRFDAVDKDEKLAVIAETQVKNEDTIFNNSGEKDDSQKIDNSVDDQKENLVQLPAKDSAAITLIPPVVHSKNPIKSRIFVGFMFNPGLSNSRLKLDETYRDREPYQSTYQDRKNEDRQRSAYSVGVFAGLTRNKHQFGIGLFYKQIEYQMPVVNVNSAILNGTGTGITRFDYNATDSFKVKSAREGGYFLSSKFQFISIPISYSYKVFNRTRFKVGLYSDASLNFLWSHSGLLIQNESGLYVKPNTASENHIQKMHLALNFGPEFSYYFPKYSSAVFIRPNYSFSLTELEKGALSTGYRIWSIGSGIQYFIR